MRVSEVMSSQIGCCTPDTNLQDVAKMMIDCDCGAIPVVDDKNHRKLIGVVTDRDITCRAVAQGKNPLQLTAADCMSTPVVAVRADTDLDECCRIMEEHLVRRIPVIDDQQCCCGIVAQADIARRAPEHETAEMVRELSQSSNGASRHLTA